MLQIKVEATTANVSVGFDVLGMSLGMYNTFTFDEALEFSFTGYDSDFCNFDNLCYKSYIYTFNKANMKPVPVKMGFKGDVPVSRGLGSSSTLIVAGVFAANYYMNNKLSVDELFDICAILEGHPDNVAPAIFGGLIASFKDDEGFHYIKYPVNKDLRFLVAIPSYKLSTHEARSVLPESYSRNDVVNNLSRIVNIPYAFNNGDISLLKKLFNDKIHEPYRKTLIKEYDIIKDIFKDDEVAVAISGSGSTILAVTRNEDYIKKLDNLGLECHVLTIGTGVKLEEV